MFARDWKILRERALMLTRVTTQPIAKCFIAFQFLMYLQLFACRFNVTRQSQLNLILYTTTMWNGPFV